MGLISNSLDVVDSYAAGNPQQTDEQLAVQASRGDQEAFAALYERYFDGLYDFAIRIVHDPDMTADIVQASFVKAWQHLQTGKIPKNIKAWLYTVVRNASVDEYRYRKRLVNPGEGEAEERLFSAFADVGSNQMSDPHAQVEDKELAELVWRSAAALRPKEYALLDMHVRQELSVEELAESLGLSKGTVYTRLSRLRDSLQESVVTVLLMNQGRRDCPDLDAILTEIQATEPTRRVRWTVREHLEECSQCQESRQRYASPLAILAALVPMPAPAGLEQLIWSRVSSQPGFTQVGSGDSLFYRWLTRLGTYRKEIFLALLVQFLVIGAGGALALSFGRPVDPDDVHSTSHGIGQPSTDNLIEMAWSFLPNAAAYSILWSQVARDLPDAVADLPGRARIVSSPALPPGDWYFHLRTQGRNGKWTSTVHLGPFKIISSQPVMISPPTPTPTVISPPVSPNNSPSLLPTAALATGLPEPTVTQMPFGTEPATESLVLNDLLVTTKEDVPITISLLTTATRADVQLVPESISVVNGPAYGLTFENIVSGDVVYVPALDFSGTDNFSYQFCDNEGACDTATVSIEVTPVNDRPVARDDRATTDQGRSVVIGVLANDRDPDGDGLIVTADSEPRDGTLDIGRSGIVTYTPDRRFSGKELFSYRVCDPGGLCDTAEVVVEVRGNAPPQANDDRAETAEDTRTIIDVAENDSDADGNLDPASTRTLNNPSDGTVESNGDGTFSYRPNDNYNGTDSFSYEICDDEGACDTATVSIEVTPVNDRPVARDDRATTDQGRSVVIGVLANDRDPDGDGLIVTADSEPRDGTLDIGRSGIVTYTPDRRFSGKELFSYRVCDPGGLCDTAEVVVEVRGNAPPQANDDRAETAEDTRTIIDVAENDSDADGNLDPASTRTLNNPSDGTVESNGDGTFSYRPNDNYNGTDSFNYEICDDEGACDTATVSIEVTPVNDRPVARDDRASLDEAYEAVIDVAENDFDVDGNLDPASVTITRRPANGTVDRIGPGTFFYVPLERFSGSVDSFEYRICDTGDLCDTATVTIELDPPIVE